MKNLGAIIISLLFGIILFFVCCGYSKNNYPNELYNVYLDGNYLGTIKSKSELEKYINETTEHLINVKDVTKTYCENEKTLDQIIQDENLQELIDNSKDVKYYEKDEKKCMDITIEDGETIEKIYTPNGLNIEKILTYNGEISTVEDVYSKIVNMKSFTIKGYQFIARDEDKQKSIYTTSKDIFEEAVNELIATYVGEENYKAYLDGTQIKIETVGSLIENVYIQEDITVKEIQIPIDEKIYTDSQELAQFLLYGDNPVTKTYVVKEGEMISDIAFNNHISNQEFLISNPKYRDENSLISVGTEVLIKETNPQLKVVIEKYIVEDKENDFKTVYQYDDTEYIGYEEIVQEGEAGLERVSQKQKIVNGNIEFVEPIGKEILKPTVDKVVIKGDKYVPNVGDLSNWAWPSESGWTITDNYEWRIHPITGERKFHQAIDIAGTGYNSAVYAANNGTVITKVAYHYSYGNYIVIDHNNGYYTLYAHMNKFMDGIEVGTTVDRGQQIGYVGSTGYSTGPHIHFEVWKNCQYCHINPWSLY